LQHIGRYFINNKKLSILTIENICKSYANHKALSNVSIDIPEQSIFGLLGPNGAGKTTLIRIINQIISSDSGTITLHGEKLNREHVMQIGYLPEERGLYKKMKVGEHLLYFARLKGLNRVNATKKIKTWFNRLDIPDWLGKRVEDLSKGMQQKVQFIGTILHDPKLIILDEPFSGFDPINANIIKDEILQLREEGSTIIFSTHRMESVEELCDHIALIHNATKILDGRKEDIKKQFKSNTYSVSHKGKIIANENFTEITTTEKEDGKLFSKIKVKNTDNPNELIKSLLNQSEIYSFHEITPAINDIFIDQIKGGNRE